MIQQLGLRYEPRYPTSHESVDKLLQQVDSSRVVKLNYASVAKVAEIPEQTLMYVLAQTVNAVGSCLRKEYNVKLAMRVGFLKFKQGGLTFDNLVGEMDLASRTSGNTIFRQNVFNMTGMSGRGTEFEDKITYHTESVKDTISQYSRRTRTPKQANSVFSKTRYGGDMIIGKADPNTIDIKDRERRPRDLNNLVEGKYSKRMSIQGKDMYKDLDVLRNHRQDLVEQARVKKDTILNERKDKQEEELDIISQIKESLNDATRKKQHVLYK